MSLVVICWLFIVSRGTDKYDCGCSQNEASVGISCVTRSSQGEKWVTARGDTFLNPDVLSKHFIADIMNDYKKIYKYRVQWFSGSWSGWYFPGVNDNEWSAKSDSDNVWNQAHKDAGRRSWTLFADHFNEVCYLMNESLPVVTSSTTTTASTTTTSTSTALTTSTASMTAKATTTLAAISKSTEIEESDITEDPIEISDGDQIEVNESYDDIVFSKWTVIAFSCGVLFMICLNIMCFAAYIILSREKTNQAMKHVSLEKEADQFDEGTANTSLMNAI